MDKKEFEQRAIAEPENKEPAFLRAKLANTENNSLVDKQRQADARAEHAMKIDIPEGLAGRILLKQSLQEKQLKREWYRSAYAIAASVLLAVVILVQVLPTTPALDEAVLTHIDDELDHLLEKRDINDETLDRLIGTFGGKFGQSIGQVNFAGLCNIRKGPGMHLVLQSAQGPVTVLIMPDEKIARRQVIGNGRFNGVILPVAEGSMAVVGENAAAITSVEMLMQKAISWNG